MSTRQKLVKTIELWKRLQKLLLLVYHPTQVVTLLRLIAIFSLIYYYVKNIVILLFSLIIRSFCNFII